MSFASTERMLSRASFFALVTAFVAATCGPTLPPTTAPPQPDPTFDPLRAALQAYVDQTQPYRRQAAQVAEDVPGKAAPTPAATRSVRARQNSLADALRTKLRPNARQGEIFTPPIAAAIKHQLENVFASPQKDLILDDLAEQNTTPSPAPASVAINRTLKAPQMPPRLIEVLPRLPKQLEYDFVGRTIILRDIDADVVVDYLPDAFPTQPPAGTDAPASAAVAGGAVSPLPLPSIRGSTTFALIGDSGSGDDAQQAVAKAMLTYFTTARRFSFVLMLGDNLYHDDYNSEFLGAYKPLLDRGVKFYAALGNHDRELEIHFKPFNMEDRDRYSFDQGNARFVALNSNHPGDPEQLKWLDGVFANAGDKWRICFFHHPLYSSGNHAAEARDVIRPALEEALVRNRVNVVFTGHEHLYERIKPQRGVHHFVSGGGGRYLYKVRPSAFDEVAVSEHHFMVAQIAGDRMLFAAITSAQKLLDCGVIYRASNMKADDTTQKWLASCDAARGRVRTTDQ
jgi:predicted phosphodiesterase